MIPIFAAFGLVIGSFLNVCIHRLPREESLWRPRSRCPRCKAPISAYDNVPLLSYLLLRGRCRRCGKPIPLRYPAVELLTGTLFGALAWRWPQEPAWAAAAAAATAALLVIAFIDWDTFLIPDVLSLGLAASGLLLSPLNPLLGESPWARLGFSALGTATGFCVCWGVAALGQWIFKKEAMGGGDVKLLAAVGAWSGALGALDCLILGSLLGSIYGGALLLGRRLRRQDPIPFGPFLSAAAIFNFFFLVPFGFPFNDSQAWAAEPRVGAAEPRVGAAEPRVGAAEPRVGAAEPRVGAAEPRVGAADQPPGRVARAAGEILFLQPEGGYFRPDLAIAGRRMDPGDQIRTGAAGRAHVSMPLGVVALLKSSSTVALELDGTRAQAAVLGGEVLFSLAERLDRGWSFSVRTDAALATTERGVFLVIVNKDRSARFRTVLGRLRVRAEGKSVRLKEGQEIVVAYEEEPGSPKPAQPPEVSTASFAIDGSLSDAELAWELPYP